MGFASDSGYAPVVQAIRVGNALGVADDGNDEIQECVFIEYSFSLNPTDENTETLIMPIHMAEGLIPQLAECVSVAKRENIAERAKDLSEGKSSSPRLEPK